MGIALKLLGNPLPDTYCYWCAYKCKWKQATKAYILFVLCLYQIVCCKHYLDVALSCHISGFFQFFSTANLTIPYIMESISNDRTEKITNGSIDVQISQNNNVIDTSSNAKYQLLQQSAVGKILDKRQRICERFLRYIILWIKCGRINVKYWLSQSQQDWCCNIITQ